METIWEVEQLPTSKLKDKLTIMSAAGWIIFTVAISYGGQEATIVAWKIAGPLQSRSGGQRRA